MAAISGAALTGHAPLPSAGILRFANDTGFTMVSVGGMLAVALSVAWLSAQARSAGLFGRKMAASGFLVALILLAAAAFIPIAALLIWIVAASVVLMRRSAAA
jgi:hypothetical protein